MIPLYREDAGREVRVEITPVYENFRDRQIDFLIGSQLAIYRERLGKDLPQLILGMMAVFVGIATMFHYSEQELLLAEKDRLLAEQEWKLTERWITAMMSQVKSHFIFNVLTTISSYCKVDAQKADRALIRFSRYLRKNIRNIEEEGLIDSLSELEQVEDYVALE